MENGARNGRPFRYSEPLNRKRSKKICDYSPLSRHSQNPYSAKHENFCRHQRLQTLTLKSYLNPHQISNLQNSTSPLHTHYRHPHTTDSQTQFKETPKPSAKLTHPPTHAGTTAKCRNVQGQDPSQAKPRCGLCGGGEDGAGGRARGAARDCCDCNWRRIPRPLKGVRGSKLRARSPKDPPPG